MDWSGAPLSEHGEVWGDTTTRQAAKFYRKRIERDGKKGELYGGGADH